MKRNYVLVKIRSSELVFVVTTNKFDGRPTLRHISSEAIAMSLFGAKWADNVIDLDVTSFSGFLIGDEILSTNDVEVDLKQMKRREDLNKKR